jgi:L-asparaginase II
MTEANQSLDHIDDNMPTEHTFSGTGTSGRFAKTLQEKGYTVTIHNEDGTTTTRYVSPQEVLEQNRQREKLKQQPQH